MSQWVELTLIKSSGRELRPIWVNLDNVLYIEEEEDGMGSALFFVGGMSPDTMESESDFEPPTRMFRYLSSEHEDGESLVNVKVRA